MPPSSASCELFGPPRVVLRLRAVPLFDGEALLGAAVFVHDVSEIHRIESVRRDFVANVSHELKTPIGALELLAETLAAGDRPRGHRAALAERLVKEAERLGRIVDDLLDLSLIEIAGGADAGSRSPVAVLLDEAIDRMRAGGGRRRGSGCESTTPSGGAVAARATGAKW